MLDELEKIVKDLIPNSPIQFFATLPYGCTKKTIANIEIPVLNDLLVREVIIEDAIRSYAALVTIDYRLELYSMCSKVQDTFQLSDKDTLARVNGLLAFEIKDEGDLQFINTYQDYIRDLTLSKLKKDNLIYLFPYYFILNRTGKHLDLTLLSVKEYSKLTDFIASERNEPDLEQLDGDTTIKKP
jgi:hypothetical protein